MTSCVKHPPYRPSEMAREQARLNPRSLNDESPPADLFALIRRPNWWGDALCREYPEVTFFPERGDMEGIAAAFAVCGRCLVRDECLDYALGLPFNQGGIFAGLSQKSLRQLKVERGATDRSSARA